MSWRIVHLTAAEPQALAAGDRDMYTMTISLLIHSRIVCVESMHPASTIATAACIGLLGFMHARYFLEWPVWNLHAGKEAAGTPHLLLGLLECGNTAVTKALDKAGVQMPELKSQV